MRYYVALLLALLAVGLVHLVRPPRASNWHRVQLPLGAQYAVDPDSPNFARIVVNFPSELTATPQGRTRLARPLYTALAWLIFVPLRQAGSLVPEAVANRCQRFVDQANHPDIWSGVDAEDVVVAWVALVAVNIILLWLALALTFFSLSSLFPKGFSIALTLVVASHVNVIRYVYVPHTDPFNVLIPSLFLLAALRVWPRGGKGYGLAIALGAAMLGKGIVYPILNWLAAPFRKYGWKEAFRASSIALLLFATPTAIYWLILKGLGVDYYNHEANHYRQVVWMLDYVRSGNLYAIPMEWAGNLAIHLRQTGLSFFSPLLCILAALVFRDVARDRVVGAPVTSWHMLVYATAGIVFWVMVGFLETRLTITHYPVVIYSLGCLARARTAPPLHLLLIGTAIVGNLLAILLGYYQ